MISWPIYLPQYGQYIGKILAALPTLSQYMGYMWLRRLSRILAILIPISCPHSCHFFFYQSVGHIISIMWENYGPYSTETSEPHMAHILRIHCPQLFLRGNYLNRKFFWFRQNKVFVSPMELDSIIKTNTTFITFFIIMKIFLLKQSSAFMQARTEKMHCEKYELIVPLLDQ